MRRISICLLAALLLWAVEQPEAGDEVFQFSATVGRTTAYLWIPPDADRVRGVLIGSQTLMEDYFSCDPAIRAACQAEKLAIVYCQPGLDAGFNALEQVLKELGQVSGYEELAVAPLLPYGHSVRTIYAANVVYWKPERCFAAFLQKGGMPGPPADAPDASALGVPILALKGQYEEFGPGPSGVLRADETREAGWQGMRDLFLAKRKMDDRYLLSLLVDPGASHMTWLPAAGPVVGEFIRKAARRRIPDWPVDAKTPPNLNELDPKSGALTRRDLDQPDGPAAAAYGQFKGDPRQAFWHLDLELAAALDAYHAAVNRGKPQFAAFADAKGNPVPPGHDLRLRLSPQWVGADTFKVSGTFHSKPPIKFPPVEGEVGHAATPIQFRIFNGAAEQVEPGLFRLGLRPRGGRDTAIVAFHPGDAEYRYNEQPAFVRAPSSKGKAQTIAFTPPPALKTNAAPVKLQATSDAGLPVRFAVEYGPAAVDGDTLRLTAIPPRARFPIKIVVHAYQHGSAAAPQVQAATTRQELVVEK